MPPAIQRYALDTDQITTREPSPDTRYDFLPLNSILYRFDRQTGSAWYLDFKSKTWTPVKEKATNDA